MYHNERNKYGAIKMKKFKISVILTSALILIFSLCVISYADSSKKAWSNDEAFSSFNTLVNNIQGEKTQNFSDIEVLPGGMPFGVKITSNGLIVVGFSSTQGKDASPAYIAGIRVGDMITKINGKTISALNDFSKIKSNDKITLTVLRDNKEMNFSFCPRYSPSDGKYKTGLLVKDSTAGIGTVTFINPETGAFGGLGHGICNSSNGKLVPFTKGTVLEAAINGVIKGKVGSAGELKGTLGNKKIGSLYKNSSCGVFGILTSDSFNSPEKKIKLAKKDEIQCGEAYIWCTLSDGEPQKYKIEISDIDVSSSSVKNFRVKVTDPRLLSQAGGIVQGMSGSPIIQNGKIIGAVTHVLINDPTQGYGIFIENMINAMPEILK